MICMRPRAPTHERALALNLLSTKACAAINRQSQPTLGAQRRKMSSYWEIQPFEKSKRTLGLNLVRSQSCLRRLSDVRCGSTPANHESMLSASAVAPRATAHAARCWCDTVRSMSRLGQQVLLRAAMSLSTTASGISPSETILTRSSVIIESASTSFIIMPPPTSRLRFCRRRRYLLSLSTYTSLPIRSVTLVTGACPWIFGCTSTCSVTTSGPQGSTRSRQWRVIGTSQAIRSTFPESSISMAAVIDGAVRRSSTLPFCRARLSASVQLQPMGWPRQMKYDVGPYKVTTCRVSSGEPAAMESGA